MRDDRAGHCGLLCPGRPHLAAPVRGGHDGVCRSALPRHVRDVQRARARLRVVQRRRGRRGLPLDGTVRRRRLPHVPLERPTGRDGDHHPAQRERGHRHRRRPQGRSRVDDQRRKRVHGSRVQRDHPVQRRRPLGRASRSTGVPSPPWPAPGTAACATNIVSLVPAAIIAAAVAADSLAAAFTQAAATKVAAAVAVSPAARSLAVAASIALAARRPRLVHPSVVASGWSDAPRRPRAGRVRP